MTIKTSHFPDHDTLLHLRVPFSFFLLPVFCFAVSQSVTIDWKNTALIFVALHLFIYPGSNAYNSYMDNDKSSIGGLKNPPPVTRKLFYASILFDIIGLFLCLLISWKIFILSLLYVGASKAYSWKKIRLKKYGFTGWLVVMFFQGGYTFMLVNIASENNLTIPWLSRQNAQAMLVASFLIGGFYPMTQIYQHEEDGNRGDFTISYKLGIRGTFIFSGILFMIACAVAWSYFNTRHFLIFILCLVPVISYFLYWFSLTNRDKRLADYNHTMRLNFISASCMIICFGIIYFLNHQ